MKASRKLAQARKHFKQEGHFVQSTCFSKFVCKSVEDYTSPAFLKDICEDYFIVFFSGKDSRYSSLPEWVDKVLPLDEVLNLLVFHLFHRGCVKKVLMECSSKSVPGPDGITYHHLKKLRSIHHFWLLSSQRSFC